MWSAPVFSLGAGDYEVEQTDNAFDYYFRLLDGQEDENFTPDGGFKSSRGSLVLGTTSDGKILMVAVSNSTEGEHPKFLDFLRGYLEDEFAKVTNPYELEQFKKKRQKLLGAFYGESEAQLVFPAQSGEQSLRDYRLDTVPTAIKIPQ